MEIGQEVNHQLAGHCTTYRHNKLVIYGQFYGHLTAG